VIATVPGPAVACTRAARLGVSPKNVGLGACAFTNYDHAGIDTDPCGQLPSGPTTELRVQLGAVVEALMTPDTPAFGAALALNCIAYMICFMLASARFVGTAWPNAAARLIFYVFGESPHLGHALPCV
jgi:hypothetical protein